MKKKYLFPLIIIILLVSGLIGSYFINIKNIDMTYTSFLNEVEQNNVKSITLNETSHSFQVNLYNDTQNTYLVTNPKTENFTEYLLLHNISVQYDSSQGITTTIQTVLIISIIGFVFLYIRKNDSSKRTITDANKKMEQKHP